MERSSRICRRTSDSRTVKAVLPESRCPEGEVVMARVRTKWVYLLANGKAEGNAKMRDLLGGKGAGLAEMTTAKFPLQPGFTITTAARNAYFRAKTKLPPVLWDQVEK